MATITLRIHKPTHKSVFFGDRPQVEFQGELVSLQPDLAGIQLYFRWYSSLNEGVVYDPQDANQRNYSLNQSALITANEVYKHMGGLSLGTHVIAFAASDCRGETEADLLSIRHGTATGGDKDAASPCIIHVIRANTPNLPTAPVPRSGLKLKAEVPWAWGDDKYHDYNQLQYRWRLKPFDPPGVPATTRPEVTITPSLRGPGFTFHAPPTRNSPAFVSFIPSLPQDAEGAYDITLFVEDRLDPVPARQAISAPQRVNLLP